MNGQFRAEDLEAVIAEGSLVDLFTALAGKQVTQPEPPDEDDGPKYHIPRKGAWPCGTAPSGPTPIPCTDCQKGEAHGSHPKRP